MSERIIVSLQAKAGKNPGEAIASHGRSIVFLPRGVETDKWVRVELHELDKTDGRGRMMYRGTPAPPEYTEKWKDNGDGTASRVTIATDWLGKTSEEGVQETRMLETREYSDHATTCTDRVVVWGNDLASSVVMKEQVTKIPTLGEFVTSDGKISLKEVSSREERSAPENLPVLRVRVWGGNFQSRKMEVAYEGSLTLTADCYCTDSDFVRENSVWGKLPAWLWMQVHAEYPVCSCGRKRILPEENRDGYGKCWFCRTAETCVRCSKKSRVSNLAGRLVCDKCQPYESAEQIIETSLPRKSREAIASEAKKLCVGQALPKEAGEAILKATLDHLTSDWRKDNLVQKWTGYGWYYFCDEGVFATKLAPAALQILQFLPQASGNGLVEMVAWLIDGKMGPHPYADFYLQTQVRDETRALPVFSSEKFAEIKLADSLRGSEKDRIAALAEHKLLVEQLGEDASEAKAVAEILQAEKQDYAAALAKMREIRYQRETRQARIDAGEIWPDVSVPISAESRTTTEAWAILPDGSIIEPVKEDTGGRRSRICAYKYGDLATLALVISHEYDNYGYRNTEKWEVHYRPSPATGLTSLQAETVKRLEEETRHYFTGRGTGWDLSKVGAVTFTTAYHRDFQGEEAELDNEMRSNLPIDVTQWETETGEDGAIVVGPHRFTALEAKAVRKAKEEVDILRGELMNLDHEKETAATECAKAEEQWLARQDAEHESSPVENGTVFLVPRFVKETSQGRESLAYGPFYDTPAGYQIKLVLDPFSGESQRITEASTDVLVRVRPRSSAQLHLFEGFLRPMDGGQKQKTFGYFAKAVLGPKDYHSRIKEAEEKLREAEARLAQLQEAAKKIEQKRKQDASIAEPPIQGSGLGTMASALLKAGLIKEKKSKEGK